MSTVPATEDTFNRLLDAMPSIAEAVNAFESKANQRAALDALLAAAGLPNLQPQSNEIRTTEPPLSVVPQLADASNEPEDPAPTAKVEDAQSSVVTSGRRRRKSIAKKSWSRVKDINFRPEGKQSLRDFVAEKQPSNFHEWNLVFVYYFEEVLGETSIMVGHVLAAYDECAEKAPAIPDNSLIVTANRKGWLDTSDLQSGGIKTTHSGRNTIKYDMPIGKHKKSA